MFVPSRYRSAYLPRTPFEKSYSARMSSLAGLVVFFIGLTFWPSGQPGVDESNLVTLCSMRNNEESALLTVPQEEPPLLRRTGMVRIRDADGVGIAEGSRGFEEADVVLTEIGQSLRGIPSKAEHQGNLRTAPLRALPNDSRLSGAADK